MKTYVILGSPGSGKGTSCSSLSSELGWSHLSTGEILRAEIALKSPLGLKISEIVAGGRLVDDSLLFESFVSFLSSRVSVSDTLLLDGVPRTLDQVHLLNSSLKVFGRAVEKVIEIYLPVDVLVSRLKSRVTCSSCGALDSSSVADLKDVPCSTCGAIGVLTRRADDVSEVVIERIHLYERQISKIRDYYTAMGSLVRIDGNGSRVDVLDRVKSVLV